MSMETNKKGEIRSPKDLAYMKLTALSLSFIALYPWKESIENDSFSNKYNIAMIIFEIIIIGLQIAYMRYNIRTTSFLKMGHTYLTFAMTVVCLQRLTMPWISEYRKVAHDFVTKIHLFHQKDKSNYAMKVYTRVHKICVFFTVFLHFQLYCTIFLFNVTPLYENYMAGMFSSNKPINGTFEHACYYELPFDYLTNFTGYILLSIINCFETYTVGSTVTIFDLFLSLVIFHIWGNLKIVKYNLDNFPKPQANQDLPIGVPPRYSEEESKVVFTTLKEIINHHRMVMDFMSMTSASFGFYLGIYLTFHQIIGCIVLMECSNLDPEALAKYGILSIFIFQQLVQVSVTFELLGSQSEMLADSVYSLPWESMELKNRKLVLFFLQNVQEPINLKACGMVPVGVRTMSTILKTSFSYFIMLRTVTTNE